jgi:hypothetical protein
VSTANDTGHAATQESTRVLVDRFNAAWNAHDLPAALALISDDCIFEATGPAPDGDRVVGRDAIGTAWAPIFANNQSRFTIEDSVAAGEHIVQRWRYDWGDGHVRGVDVIIVSHGQITANDPTSDYHALARALINLATQRMATKPPPDKDA